MRHLYLIRIPVGRTLQVVDGSGRHQQEARNKKEPKETVHAGPVWHSGHIISTLELLLTQDGARNGRSCLFLGSGNRCCGGRIVEGEATQKVVNLTRSPMLVTAADPAVI